MPRDSNTIQRASLPAPWLLAGLLAISQNGVAEERGQFTFSTGLDFSKGDYGEEQETKMVYLPFTIKYTHFPWISKASLPYLHINGPASVVGGLDGGEVIESDSNENRSVSGPGDIILSTGRALDTLWDANLYADLIAKVKLPYADEGKGLGTGEADFQLQLDLASLWGRYTPMATIGYKWPGYSSFDNQGIVSLGIDYKLSDSQSSGFFYDFREASSDSKQHLREVMLYLNHKFNREYSLNTYLVTGFSDNSVEKGIGIQFSIKK